MFRKGRRPLQAREHLAPKRRIFGYKLGHLLLIHGIPPGTTGPTRNLPPLDPPPNLLHLFLYTPLNGLLIPILHRLHLLEHMPNILRGLFIIDLHQPLNLFFLVEGLFGVLLVVQHAEDGRVVTQVLQLLFEETLFWGVLAHVVVLDADFVQLEQAGGDLGGERFGGLELHLGHEEVVGVLGRHTAARGGEVEKGHRLADQGLFVSGLGVGVGGLFGFGQSDYDLLLPGHLNKYIIGDPLMLLDVVLNILHQNQLSMKLCTHLTPLPSSFNNAPYSLRFKHKRVVIFPFSMQAKHLSFLLFQQPQQQPSSYHPTRTLSDLFNQLTQLNRKILNIELHQQTIQQKVNALSVRVVKGNDKSDGKGNMDEVLMFLERKLQALVEESEKMIEEIKREVERVLTREILKGKMKKMESAEEVGRVEKGYQQRMKVMEEMYQGEVEGVKRRNQAVEQGFEKRIQEIEHKFINKIKELVANQHKLKAKIAQQQQQIKALTDNLKNKSTITQKTDYTPQASTLNFHKSDIKHTRPHLIDVKSIKEHILDEASEKDGCSRIRRNKIFDKRSTKVQRRDEISPIKNADYSDLNSLKILNNDLDKFEDFKEHQLDGSDEDVFFYPENTKDPDFIAMLAGSPQCSVVNTFKMPEQNSKPIAFSPFDIS